MKFQEIAETANGSRTALTGYNSSVAYVQQELLKHTDYELNIQSFEFAFYQELATPIFTLIEGASQKNLTANVNFRTLRYSGSGSVGPASLIDVGGGCQMSDYANFTAGSVALISRGFLTDCLLPIKIQNAWNHSAVGVVVSYDPGSTGLFSAGLETLAPFPAFSVTYDVGVVLRTTIGDLKVSMYAKTEAPLITTHNLLAYTKGGEFPMIVVGSHLDGVLAGPGINDNGSGSSTNLELAIALHSTKLQIKNKVLFAWWAAEEFGLLGSKHYVKSFSGDIKQTVALNLNFDMLGSPNFQRGIHNGTSANETIRVGSAKIQGLLQQYFESAKLPYELIPFSGRSDYGPFIEVGIPAGGLATGAEGIKDAAGRDKYGGFANTAYDPCYHQYCDTIDNVSQEVIVQMARAAAHSVASLALQENLRDYLHNA